MQSKFQKDMRETDRKDISTLDSLISAATKITTISHIRPDGDAVGSSIAMLSFLESLGKDACSVLPHNYPDALSFLVTDGNRKKILIHENNPEAAEVRLKESDLIICLDFNDFSRTDMLEKTLLESGAAKILIDHHLNPDTDKFSLVFSETETSSTAELLYQILMLLPQTGGDAGRLPALSATALMTGMTTDTNNFANSVYPGTLLMASSLLAAGVDRDAIIENLFNSCREERIRLMGKMLFKKMKITEDGVAYMILDRKTIMKYGIKEGETEGFVNMPLSIADVRMSIFLKQDKDRFRVSLRSKKGTSANLCAKRYFNGGGHELASGGRLMIPDDVRSPREAAEYIRKVTHQFMKGNE